MPRRRQGRDRARGRREQAFQSRQRTVSRASVDQKFTPAAVDSITKGATWGGQQGGTANTSLALSAQTVTVRDFVVVGVYIRGGPATGVTLGSSLGNTYANLGGVTAGSSRSELWGGFVTIGGSETLTFSWVTAGAATSSAALFKGLAGTSAATALDVAVVSNSGTTSAISSAASANTVFPGDLVITYSGQIGVVTLSSPAFSPPGFPYVLSDTQFQGSGADASTSQLSSTQSDIAGLPQSFTLTSTNAAQWINFLATFRAANVVLQSYAVTVATPTAVVPGVSALVLAKFAPVVATPRAVTPGVRALVLATFAPSVTTPRLVTPSTRALILATFAPFIALPKAATPSTRALVLATFAPTVSASAGVNVMPGTRALVLTGFAPSLPGIATAPTGSQQGGMVRRLYRAPAQRPRARPAKPTPQRRKPVVIAVAVDDTDALVALYAAGAIDLQELAALIAA